MPVFQPRYLIHRVKWRRQQNLRMSLVTEGLINEKKRLNYNQFTLHQSVVTPQYFMVYPESTCTYNSIFYFLRCINMYLHLNILWFTLHKYVLTSKIFYGLHCIDLYLQLNILWFTLHRFVLTTQYFMIYADILQCYSIFECE